MRYIYPIDVADLAARLERRGEAAVKFVGIQRDMRDDVKLTHIVWGAGLGWFPVRLDRSWSGAIDIGLPDWRADSFRGTPVYSIADGEVVYADPQASFSQAYTLGRVIVKHRTPEGQDFYALYKHIEDIGVTVHSTVSMGDTLGVVGAYGYFPHLTFGIASLFPLGAPKDLAPECPEDLLPTTDGVFNILRVKVERLDPVEWPVDPIQGSPGYLFNPIEVVRYCRTEPYIHDIGAGSRHAVSLRASSAELSVPANSFTQIEITPLRSRELMRDPALLKLAQDPSTPAIRKGHTNKDTVKAIQQALKVCQYEVGRFGPDNDGIDGDFGTATESIIKSFQSNKLKPLFDSDLGHQLLSMFGQRLDSASTDGSIDWLTLIGLDLFAVAHGGAPSTPPPITQPPPAPLAPSTSSDEISLADAKSIILKCTAVFEGTWNEESETFDFGRATPNFDYAGLSAGIIQWNIGQYTLFPLLRKMRAAAPDAFRNCYEGGTPTRFKPYFQSSWPPQYGADIWSYQGFETLLSANHLPLHFLWVKHLHKPEAIMPSDANENVPGWITKPNFGTAHKALRPELIDFLKRLGQVPEFQEIQKSEAWTFYISKALSTLAWLRDASKTKYPDLLKRVEFRTFAALFDLAVQQGGFGKEKKKKKSSAKTAKSIIRQKIESGSYASQKDLVAMAVTERAGTARSDVRNDCASRRLGFLNAKATHANSFGTPGITRVNCHFHLLETNPYVHGI